MQPVWLKYDPEDVPAAVDVGRCNAITGVNTLFNLLLNAPGSEKVSAANADALKLAVAGGRSVQRAVAERWPAAMGVPLLFGFADRPVFALTGGLVGGHTLKHVVAALAVLWVAQNLQWRRFL